MLKKLLKCSIYFSFICSWLIINAMDFESEVDAGLNTPSLVKAHKNMAEQDSWLCAIPRNCIWQICAYLESWQEINNLGIACKQLDCLVTIPLKPLAIYGGLCRKQRSCRDFLCMVYHIIARMAARDGNNVVELQICLNELSEDEILLKKLFESLAFAKVSHTIKCLNLSCNGLTKIPEPCVRMANLETLYLEDNKLTADDIPSLEHMKQLQVLRLGGNRLSRLPLGISSLPALRELSINGNELTKDVLPYFENCAKLVKLDISSNLLTLADVARALKSSQHIKKLEAQFLDAGDLTEEDWCVGWTEGLDIFFSPPGTLWS